MQQGLKPGDVLDGRYVLRERIGQGGMGCVFLADQPALRRSVAIKVLHPELADTPAHARRFQDEAVIACHVRSPHCVEVFDSGVLVDGTPYIVMEHVPGRPLGRIIADEPISLSRALDLFDQILCALADTHRSGVLHGDVKTDNFLVELVDGIDHVTLIDFGLAQPVAAPARVDRDHGITISGTPEYMAPERIAGDPASPASDLYGAGVILYELLTGTTPFGGGTAMEIMSRQTRDEAIPPSQRRPDRAIPPVIDRIVLRALDKRPEARFADAASFARELRAAAPSVPSRPPVADSGSLQAAPGGDTSTPRSRRRLARGSDCGSSRHGEEVEAMRREIGGALRRGDVAAIADGYLQLGNALAGDGELASAIHELQEGVDILTTGGDPRGSDAPPGVDRLAVALAALYEAAGDQRLARHAATSTDHSPTWTFAIG